MFFYVGLSRTQEISQLRKKVGQDQINGLVIIAIIISPSKS